MILKKVVENLWALVCGLIAAYGLVCLYAVVLGDYFLFATQPSTYTLAKDGKDNNIVLADSPMGNRIPVLYLKYQTPSSSQGNKRFHDESPIDIEDPAPYVILYSHGNLEDLGFVRPRLELFRKHGFSVLSYDYPGFGACPGAKNETSCFDAAEAAYKYLTQTQKIPPEKIIFYGRSMGGGPTAYLASKYKVAATVMHSTFVSAYRVQTGIRLIPWDRFENLKRVPHIKSPILFIHGLSDETIPVWHTRMMMESVRNVPTMGLLVPYALHNNVIEMARDDYWTKLDEFVAAVAQFNIVAAQIAAPTPMPHSSPEADTKGKQIARETIPAAPLPPLPAPLPTPTPEPARESSVSSNAAAPTSPQEVNPAPAPSPTSKSETLPTAPPPTANAPIPQHSPKI